MPMSISPTLLCGCLLGTLLLGGCVSPNAGPVSSGKTLIPGDPSAPSQTTPTGSLAVARELSNHSWRPFANNIRHGKDRVGVLVNTADASYEDPSGRRGWWLPGEVNVGIPYKWGGFDNSASFDGAVSRGLAAGDVSSPEKRRLGDSAVSAEAAGLDCSGFVSRCLKLPSVHDTRQLPSVCSKLAGPQELRPGDLLNIPGRHVLLCAGWATPDRKWIYFYETGGEPEYWKPGLKQAPLDALLALGYQPMRYRGMASEPRIDGKEVMTRAVLNTAVAVPNPTVGEP